MIFNCDHVTELVDSWLITDDVETLDRIMRGSYRLASVIAAKFPKTYREDLIQECLLRIPYAVQHYNKEISSLHKYLTSVFINRCLTYIKYEERQQRLASDLGYLHEAIAIDIYDIKEELLREITIRNRKRFPTIPVDVLDSVSEYVLECILDGMSIKGKSRGAIAYIVANYGLRRNVALVIYHSTLVYLRTQYSGFRFADVDNPKELSLLPELKNILGDEAYKRISIIFSGLHFRVP